MKKILFIVPVISPEVTDGFFETIPQEFHKDFYVVDNFSDSEMVLNTSKYSDAAISRSGENIGVGRAWNRGIKHGLQHDYEVFVILSATMRFAPGGFQGWVEHINANPNPWGIESQHAWHCIAFTKKTIETVGFFDENFYPAYYEDSDYIRRMEILGIHNPMSATQRLPKVDIAAGFEGNAHGMRKGGVVVNMEACRQYFIDKWGAEPRYETQRQRDLLFRFPFNNPSNTIDYWVPRTIGELKAKYNLNSAT